MSSENKKVGLEWIDDVTLANIVEAGTNENGMSEEAIAAFNELRRRSGE